MSDETNIWESTRRLAQNFARIRERIHAALLSVGRGSSDTRLVAVSKTVGPEVIEQAWTMGISIFGESRVQNLVEKMEHLPDDLVWHFIGHLQTNKVKYLVGRVSLIHSVDSLKLAKIIDEEARKRGLIQDVLCEINVSGEQSKDGFDRESFLAVSNELATLEGVRIRGLMTMAPFVSDERVIRPCFRRLRELLTFVNVRHVFKDPIVELSMGMSNDYPIAIEEGATLVRIGTSLFHGEGGIDA